MSYGIFPLGETTVSPVVRTILLAIPAIPDAQGNTGSTLPVQRTISFPDGSSLNETVEMQAMACAWSAINQTGTLDVSTNTLLSVNPVAPQPSSQWLTLDPSAINDDATMQEINGFSMVWLPGLPSGINRTSPCDVSADNYLGGCEFSNIDIRIMDALGRYTDLSAGNQSSVSTPAVTLSDLEKALGDVFAAFFWAGARISEGPLSRSSLDFQEAVTKMYPESRLNINVVPVIFGLAASTTLFVLAIVLTRMHATPDAMTTRPAVISAGILQVLWLSARHTHARERIAEVEEPEPDALRKAGMFAVSLGRVPTDEYSWTIESSGTDAFGSTEHLKP
ncbi:hypothetical protein BV22DRAFT_785690 [Leucogyrophana mollusca]|uniref:Uncharacterized protein n=1 Tax=Leucogyrophana mollusca TaxID=85980 RepID=A0ACB8B584_9AGAM|nr:hypothetical protein BV22DRAFT_785690 [Leucogyrophana mollusca]